VAIQGNEHCRHNHRYQRCTKCRKTLLLTHFIRSKESSGEDFEVRERHHTCRHCHIKNLDNDRNNMVKNPSGRTWLDGEPDEYDRWYRGQIHDESMDVSGFIDVIEAVHALPFEKVTMVPDVDKTFPYWEC
jgi:hypothetical protein